MQNVYLANLGLWLVKLHNLHWNVTGKQFVPVHQFTEALYDAVFEQYDAVAEVMKMQDKMPLVRMSQYLEVATLEETDGRDFSVEEVLDMVEADMKTMQALAQQIRDEAAKEDDFQVQGLYEGYLAYYAKQLWFLRAIRKECGCCCSK